MPGRGWACSGCRSGWRWWGARSSSSRARAARPCSSASRCPAKGRGSTMAELRVFIADDHSIVREGMKALVNAQPGMRVVGEASDGREACRAVEELQPDVAVMDITMPGWGGAEATERLKRTCPAVRVVALTVHEDESYLRGLLGAGAAGYVLKRSASEDLVHAIRTVAAG